MARVLAQRDLQINLDDFTEFTLPGILETVALVTGGPLAVLQPWVSQQAKRPMSAVGKAWRMWQHDGAPNTDQDIHSTRTVEYYRLHSRDDRTSAYYLLFEQRFARSLIKAGFPKNFAYALAGAFGEMTDNVVQHSESNKEEYSGLAGYHVEEGYTAFIVVDAGQGVLLSLTQSWDWKHLRTAQKALRAAVCDHASNTSSGSWLSLRGYGGIVADAST